MMNLVSRLDVPLYKNGSHLLAQALWGPTVVGDHDTLLFSSTGVTKRPSTMGDRGTQE